MTVTESRTVDTHLIMKTCMIVTSLVIVSLSGIMAEIGRDGRTFGSCDTLRCMFDHGQAQYCCDSGRNRGYENIEMVYLSERI